MRTFVINLERSPERRAFMHEQLTRLSLPYELLNATDGQTLTAADISNLYDTEQSLRYIKVALRPNEIACAHSHRRVYEKILAEKIPYALVLEDDIILENRIREVLAKTFLESHQFDWLQIDYPDVGWPFLKNWLRGSLHYTKRNPFFALYALFKFPYIAAIALYESLREKLHPSSIGVGSFARPLYLASAYIVTYEGAEKLLSISDKILFAADMLPNKARVLTGLRMKGTIPSLAEQNRVEFDSEIGSR